MYPRGVVPRVCILVYPASLNEEQGKCQVIWHVMERGKRSSGVPVPGMAPLCRCNGRPTVINMGAQIGRSKELQSAFLGHLKSGTLELVNNRICQSFELFSLQAKYTYCSTAHRAACSRRY